MQFDIYSLLLGVAIGAGVVWIWSLHSISDISRVFANAVYEAGGLPLLHRVRDILRAKWGMQA